MATATVSRRVFQYWQQRASGGAVSITWRKKAGHTRFQILYNICRINAVVYAAQCTSIHAIHKSRFFTVTNHYSRLMASQSSVFRMLATAPFRLGCQWRRLDLKDGENLGPDESPPQTTFLYASYIAVRDF
jgi:hypothetical protein